MRTQLVPVLLLALPLLAGCPSKDGGGGGGDTITVSGQVRNGAGGGASGIQVLVSGQVATSDSAGNFTIEDVEAPYDIFVYDPIAQFVTGVLGATRADPVLLLSGVTDREGTLDVTLSPASVGGSSSVTVSGIYSYTGSSDPDTFLLPAQWAGDSSRDATVYVTRVIDTSGIISHVYDHGSADVTFQDNQTIAVPITMNPIASATVDVTTTLAPGYEFVFTSVATSLASNSSRVVLFNGFSTTTPQSYTVFDSALYRTRAAALAVPSGGNQNDGYGTHVLSWGPGTTAVTLEPPVRLELTSPATGSAFATGSIVSWTGPLAATANYVVTGSPAVTGPTFQITVGPATSFTMPDLSPLGVTFPAGAYLVNANGSVPGLAPDEFLASNPVYPDSGTTSQSETRSVQMTP